MTHISFLLVVVINLTYRYTVEIKTVADNYSSRRLAYKLAYTNHTPEHSLTHFLKP